MYWLAFNRNPPEYTRKGSWEAPQHGQFSLFSLLKSSKQRCNRTVGTHHSHDLGIGLKMFIYHHSFIPENLSLAHDTHDFSIKIHEILHYKHIHFCLSVPAKLDRIECVLSHDKASLFQYILSLYKSPLWYIKYTMRMLSHVERTSFIRYFPTDLRPRWKVRQRIK